MAGLAGIEPTTFVSKTKMISISPKTDGGKGGTRTLTGHRMKVLHYHYATLPYRNTFKGIEP